MIGAVIAVFLLVLQLVDLSGLLPHGPWAPYSLLTFPVHTNVLPSTVSESLVMRQSQTMIPPDAADQVVLTIFLVSAIICLTCSATFHTLACHSQPVAKSINRLDYVGIVVLIVGSNIPALRYGLYCHPNVHHFYLSMILLWGMLAMYTVVQPKYATPKFRPVRAGVFVALGLSGVAPILHGVYLSGRSEFVFSTLGYKYVVWSGAMYIFGTLLYVAHIPERFAPGTFDYIGASHQLFHTCVLIAAMLHLAALRHSYIFWHAVETTTGDVGREAVCRALTNWP